MQTIFLRFASMCARLLYRIHLVGEAGYHGVQSVLGKFFSAAAG